MIFWWLWLSNFRFQPSCESFGRSDCQSLAVNMISSRTERKTQVKETLKSLVNITKFTAEPPALLLWGYFWLNSAQETAVISSRGGFPGLFLLQLKNKPKRQGFKPKIAAVLWGRRQAAAGTQALCAFRRVLLFCFFFYTSRSIFKGSWRQVPSVGWAWLKWGLNAWSIS